MKISAAICSYDRYEYLAAAIASLTRQSLPANDFEVLVIDNSPDAERSKAEYERHAHVPNLRWIYEAKPGLSNARNVAIDAAHGPFIAFLDDDAIASAGWLAALVAAYAQFAADVDIVGGPIAPKWPSERPAWLGDELLPYVSVIDLGTETRLLRENEWLAGANISYRRARLQEVGGFNVTLGRVGAGISLMSNDETELAERLQRSGGKIGYCAAAHVDHHVDASRLTQSWFRRRIAWQAVSAYVQTPADMYGSAPQSWRDLKKFLAYQQPADRTLRALALPQANVGDFRWQMSAVFNAVVCLLSGTDEENAP